MIARDLGVDTTTPAGELVANVMAAVAHWERRAIGERTKAAVRCDAARAYVSVKPSGLVTITTETVRKTVMALAMIFDHAGVEPNPARDKRTVKLARVEREEIRPPTAAHVPAVHDLLPTRYRLPLLVLDDTGMRLSELERLTWGDVDEPRRRWRVSASASKTGRARWVKVSPAVFAGVAALYPRDDRTAERRVFQGFEGDRYRTAIGRACTAAGVPTFSPHDLRHRRISLLLREEDPVTVARLVGHARASMSLDVYGHVLTNGGEVDYSSLLRDYLKGASAPGVLPSRRAASR